MYPTSEMRRLLAASIPVTIVSQSPVASATETIKYASSLAADVFRPSFRRKSAFDDSWTPRSAANLVYNGFNGVDPVGGDDDGEEMLFRMSSIDSSNSTEDANEHQSEDEADAVVAELDLEAQFEFEFNHEDDLADDAASVYCDALSRKASAVRAKTQLERVNA